MNELHEWLEAHRIAYRPIDREVVEIEGFGKLFLADLSGVKSIFRVRGAEVEFNLMERPEVLLSEGIEYVAFPCGEAGASRHGYHFRCRAAPDRRCIPKGISG